MARKLAKSTLERFGKRLEEERERLSDMLQELEEERENARLTETSSERSPDPNSVEGGSMVFEYEKELSIAQNVSDLLSKVEHAEKRLAKGAYGQCEMCGSAIPIARLEVLPYATTCVECAAKR